MRASQVRPAGLAAFAPRLRAAGHDVVGLDIAAGADTQIIGSVANPGVIQNAFDRGVEAVIHAASLHKPISRAIPRRPLSM
jgi:nucleoside-diphosphate-sugar epimerase